MSNYKDQLWPYNKFLAFLAIPFIWLVFAVIFIVGQKYGIWQNDISGSIIIIISIISFIPMLLVLLDYFSLKGAVIDIKGVKIDFSKVDTGTSGSPQMAFELPDNIGIEGAVITDSAAMNIKKMLNVSDARHEIVIVNLKSGNAWWVTRLLVLCAGAVRTGFPKVLVFLGEKENNPNCFLGLGNPDELLKAILNDKPDYLVRYNKAMKIAQQFLTYKSMTGLVPSLVPTPDIVRYSANSEYFELDDEVTEQIILDQMGNFYFDINKQGSLEDPPDRLTINRLSQLFDHCLFKDFINLNSDDKDQINRLLSSKACYLALVMNDQYVSILKKSDGESLILKELVQEPQRKNK
jgi:hypothetical protein